MHASVSRVTESPAPLIFTEFLTVLSVVFARAEGGSSRGCGEAGPGAREEPVPLPRSTVEPGFRATHVALSLSC